MGQVRRLMAIGLFVLLLLSTGWPAHADLKSDESCLFFPSQTYQTDAERWEVPLRGWVYEPEEGTLVRSALLASFRGLFGRDWTEEERVRFSGRARWFLTDSERGKSVTLLLGSQRHPIGPSDADGLLRTILPFFDNALPRADEAGWASFTIEREPGVVSPRKGWVQQVSPTGVSVISDIDDTIKVSTVTDRKELMRNTFLRPFQAVEGMADLYTGWADQGAAFHYVSGSPWQLYPVLSKFFDAAAFPRGGYYLREFSLGPSGLADIASAPKDAKARWIETLMDRYPERIFILVGDSGEADPEIYGDVARDHPKQVARILIRDVTGQVRSDERYTAAFQQIDPTQWQLFSTGDELQTTLPGLHRKSE